MPTNRISRYFCAGILCVSLFPSALTANPVIVVTPPPPPTGPIGDPRPIVRFGPGLPYISGRLAEPLTSVAPPVGLVVPDDFCLPGKFLDCGNQLRNQSGFFPQSQEGPEFVGVGNLSFSQVRQSAWIEARSRQTDLSAENEQRNLTSYSAGADRRFGNSLIIGAMVVNIDATTSFTDTGIDDQENGLFFGPYFAYQLTENLTLDGRFVVGNADHAVFTGGVFTAEYQSFSGFGAVRLSGSFARNQWRVYPSVEISTQFQNSDAYIDGLRGPIPASNTTESFATAAVLAYYDGLSLGNAALAPYVGFEATAALDGAGGVFGTFRAGLSATLGTGATLNIDYAYGAIGLPDVDDQQISLLFEVPL